MSTSTLSPVTFRDILVACDFSDYSERALQYAKAIARQYGSHMLLLHVSEPVNPIMTPEGKWFEPDYDGDDTRVESAGVMLREEGFAADAVNVYGPIEDRILAAAETRHIDLIVLGTRARHGMDRFLFGSSAEKLARAIDCPALLIGPKVAPARDAWKPKTILCATSLYPSRVRPLVFAYTLAQSNQAALTVFHVRKPNQAYDQQVWEAFLDAVSSQIPEAQLDRVEKKTFISEDGAAREICELAKDRKADLIVMGARHSTLHSSRMHGVLAETLGSAPCPILTLRT